MVTARTGRNASGLERHGQPGRLVARGRGLKRLQGELHDLLVDRSADLAAEVAALGGVLDRAVDRDAGLVGGREPGERRRVALVAAGGRIHTVGRAGLARDAVARDAGLRTRALFVVDHGLQHLRDGLRRLLADDAGLL